MRPETLRSEFIKILSTCSSVQVDETVEDLELHLSDTEMFKLWNMLGEELGIDLSLASAEHRRLLFQACQEGKAISAKDFGSLLWLVYYGDMPAQ